jgi:ssDNA-binding Zn-finger/Zn-ribbon topoisomerase 1
MATEKEIQSAAAAVTLPCPECGAPMALRPSRFGPFYGCSRWRETGCRGSHGAHPNGAPLGTPATRLTKDARIRAHDAFDRLWQNGRMKRSRAYRWLRIMMNLSKPNAHIGKFTIEQCDRLVLLVERELARSPACAPAPTRERSTPRATAEARA